MTVKWVSLFEPGRSDDLPAFVRRALEPIVGNGYTHVLMAPAVEEMEILLRGGTSLVTLSRISPYSDIRSRLRKVSVSGHRSDEHAQMVLRGLVGEPYRGEWPVPSLHVHLAHYGTMIGGTEAGEPKPGPDPDAPLYELIEKPAATMDDLILPAEVKDRIRRNLVVLKHQQVLFETWGMDQIPGFKGRAAASLNFLGVSGTGKSFAAEVIANELGRALMIVDYGQLESKYVGETSKHIQRVFREAKAHGEVVILFDEADSFLGRRVEDVQHSTDTAVNNTRSVMLMELNKFRGVIIFTTNLVSNYDPAFRRRILDHIEFPLPDARARAAILSRHVPPQIPGKDALDLDAIARRCDGFSGGDLANLVYKACLMVLERWDRDGSTPGVTERDFLDGLEEIKASQIMIRKRYYIKEFTDQEAAEQEMRRLKAEEQADGQAGGGDGHRGGGDRAGDDRKDSER